MSKTITVRLDLIFALVVIALLGLWLFYNNQKPPIKEPTPTSSDSGPLVQGWGTNDPLPEFPQKLIEWLSHNKDIQFINFVDGKTATVRVSDERGKEVVPCGKIEGTRVPEKCNFKIDFYNNITIVGGSCGQIVDGMAMPCP